LLTAPTPQARRRGRFCTDGGGGARHRITSRVGGAGFQARFCAREDQAEPRPTASAPTAHRVGHRNTESRGFHAGESQNNTSRPYPDRLSRTGPRRARSGGPPVAGIQPPGKNVSPARRLRRTQAPLAARWRRAGAGVPTLPRPRGFLALVNPRQPRAQSATTWKRLVGPCGSRPALTVPPGNAEDRPARSRPQGRNHQRFEKFVKKPFTGSLAPSSARGRSLRWVKI